MISYKTLEMRLVGTWAVQSIKVHETSVFAENQVKSKSVGVHGLCYMSSSGANLVPSEPAEDIPQPVLHKNWSVPACQAQHGKHA